MEGFEFIIPRQEEFVVPRKFLDKTSLSIDQLNLSLEISIPAYKHQNRVKSNINKIFGRFTSFKPIFKGNLKVDLLPKNSSGLVNNVKSKHHTFVTHQHQLDEVEYRISNTIDDSPSYSGSFLTNPPKAKGTLSKNLVTKKWDINKNFFKCLDYLFTENSTGGLYLLPVSSNQNFGRSKYINL